ncbi:hypothetical protein LJC14_02695 [Treponema sp. OttesenSCG-928-L16]|nr:hypothetical protein [Treponema sp. OttesenSCG-928-L16]
MDVYRPLRSALFIYDIIRLGAMLALLSVFVNAPGTGINTVFPFFVYAVPQALFPLMALFLRLSLSEHLPYTSLYIAGKCMAALSSFIWLFLSVNGILESLAINIFRTLLLMGLIFLFAALDAVSVLGMMHIKRKISTEEAQPLYRHSDGSGEEAEQPAGGSEGGGIQCE